MRSGGRIRLCGALVATTLVLCAGAAGAQVNPASSVVDPETGAASPARSLVAPIRFDVVSIRRVTVPSDHSAIESRPDGDEIAIRNLEVKWVIDFAYDFERADLVSGLPDWASKEKYDIIARVSDSDIMIFAAWTRRNDERCYGSCYTIVSN